MTITPVPTTAVPAAGLASPAKSGQADPAAAALFGLLVGQHLESAQQDTQAGVAGSAPATPGPLAAGVLATALPASGASTEDPGLGEEHEAPDAATDLVTTTGADPAVAAAIGGLLGVPLPANAPTPMTGRPNAPGTADAELGTPVATPPSGVVPSRSGADAARSETGASVAGVASGHVDQATPGPTPLPVTGTIPVPTLAAPGPAEPAPAPGSRSAVLDQVLPTVSRVVLRGDGTSRLTLKLHPADLGEVHLTVTVRGHQVDVTMAAGARAREALDEGTARLRGLLEGIGHTAGQVVVRELASPSGTANASGPTPPGPDHRADGGPAGHPQQQTDGQPRRGRPDTDPAPLGARAGASTQRLPPTHPRQQPSAERGVDVTI
jgi:flagellar hook-length control protein FliK